MLNNMTGCATWDHENIGQLAEVDVDTLNLWVELSEKHERFERQYQEGKADGRRSTEGDP